MTGQATRQMPVVMALAKGGCMTTAALTERLNIDRRAIADACSKLVSRGWIVRRERGCFELSLHGHAAMAKGDVIVSGPRGPATQEAPVRRRETGRDVIWRTIRILRKFSLAELEIVSGQSHANVQRYTAILRHGGYLVALRRQPGTSPTSNGFGRWALVVDPGPLAPVWRAGRREIFDPNGRAREVGR